MLWLTQREIKSQLTPPLCSQTHPSLLSSCVPHIVFLFVSRSDQEHKQQGCLVKTRDRATMYSGSRVLSVPTRQIKGSSFLPLWRNAALRYQTSTIQLRTNSLTKHAAFRRRYATGLAPQSKPKQRAKLTGEERLFWGAAALILTLALSQLGGWPDWGTYRYKAITQKNGIRVLILRPGKDKDPIDCGLREVSLDSNPTFDALSYVWGDSTIRKPIKCGGKHISVTVNLYAALDALRHPTDPRVLWVDALCINQEDLDERSAQIPLMSRIYRQADRVLVWLGYSTPRLERAFDTLEQLHAYLIANAEHYEDNALDFQRSRRKGKAEREQTRKLSTEQVMELRNYDWDAVRALLSNPWFVRMWTLQECVLAKRPVFVCGQREMPFNLFYQPVTEILSQGLIQELVLSHFDSDLSTMAGYYRIALSLLGFMAGGLPLLALVKHCSTRMSTDPRDKIYAVLGLASDVNLNDWELKADYSASVEEVYRRFAHWCMVRNKNLEILSYARKEDSKNMLDTPSWVADWSSSQVSNMMSLSQNTSICQASGQTVPCISVSPDRPDTLIVKGLCIDQAGELAVSYSNLTEAELFRSVIERLHLGLQLETDTRDLREAIVTRQLMALRDCTFDQARQMLDALELLDRYRQPHITAQDVVEITWIEGCKEIAFSGASNIKSEKDDAFWRTMICNHRLGQAPAPSSFARDFEKRLQTLDELKKGTRRSNPGNNMMERMRRDPIENPLHPEQPERPSLALQVTGSDSEPLPEYSREETEIKTLWEQNGARSLCVTSRGRLGWVPDSAQKGDIICIFYGANVPFLLRPNGDGRYKLLGEAYIHGMMNGEAIGAKGMKEEEFMIC